MVCSCLLNKCSLFKSGRSRMKGIAKIALDRENNHTASKNAYSLFKSGRSRMKEIAKIASDRENNHTASKNIP